MNRAEVEELMVDIVTTGEIARMFGVSQPAVSNWTKRYASFPRPLKVIGKAEVYWWPEVEAWYDDLGWQGDSRVG